MPPWHAANRARRLYGDTVSCACARVCDICAFVGPRRSPAASRPAPCAPARSRDGLAAHAQDTLALAREQAAGSVALAAGARVRLRAAAGGAPRDAPQRLDPLVAEADELAAAAEAAGRANPKPNPGAGATGGPERRRSGLLPDDPIVPTPPAGGAAGSVTPVGPPAAAASRFDALREGGGGAFGGLIGSPAAGTAAGDADSGRLANGVHGRTSDANPAAPANGGSHLGYQGTAGGGAGGAGAEEPPPGPESSETDAPASEGFAEARGSRRRGPRRKRGAAAAGGAAVDAQQG